MIEMVQVGKCPLCKEILQQEDIEYKQIKIKRSDGGQQLYPRCYLCKKCE
jgi:hypothetical protein